MIIKIATRQSPLALWQANYVRQKLLTVLPNANIELVGIKTIADKFLATSLQKIGGKGLFVKELEASLLSGDCDIAVHSMKDMPAELPEGLQIASILARDDPRDCLVGNTLNKLPLGATVGTSSLRRSCQLRALRSDINIKAIRGNLQTRLAKLYSGKFDALLLATAGLERLELSERIAQHFEIDQMLPAVAQGAIGIETTLTPEPSLKEGLNKIHDPSTAICIEAERSVNATLGGHCHLPLAAYAELLGDQIKLKALVGSIKSPGIILRAEMIGPKTTADALGESVAKKLLAEGAQKLIDEANALL